MKKILITGANGFLAQSLLALMDSSNTECVALIRPCSSITNQVFARTYHDLKTLFANESDFSLIYHFAAYIPYGSMNKPDMLLNDNIVLTSALVSAYPEAKFVYASSVSVYGNPEVLPIRIDSPFVDPDLYGLSKLAGEASVRNHANHAIIRFSSIIGPGMRPNSFVPKIAESAKKNKRITLLGDGSRLQNYIDVRDAANLCMLCANSDFTGVLLGVSEKSCSNLEIAELIKEFTQASIVFDGKDLSPSNTYDEGARYKKIGFKTQYSIKQTLKDIIQG